MRSRLATVDAMLVACVLMWAFNFTVTKYLLEHGFRPLAFSVVRYGLAALIFGLVTLGIERSLRAGGRRDLALLAGAAFVLSMNQVAFVYALEFTTATITALVLGTTPIFAALAAAAVGMERISSRMAIAIVASFAGVVMVALGTEGGVSKLSGDVKGILLSVGMSITWALYSVAIAPLMRRYSPYRISAIVLVATWIPLAAIGARQVADQEFGSFDWRMWLGLAYAVIGPLVVTNVLWYTAVARIGPSRASLFANLNPFAAAIIALLVLDETMTSLQVAGGFAIAAGILLSRGPASPAPRAE